MKIQKNGVIPIGTRKYSYAENMYWYLIRNGYEKEFRHAGIYCIKANNEILYIGKSDDMLRRLAEHYVGIKTRSE